MPESVDAGSMFKVEVIIATGTSTRIDEGADSFT